MPAGLELTGGCVPAGGWRHLRRQLPVGMSGRVGFQQDVGVDQHQALDLELAGQQRQQAELQFQPWSDRHLRTGEARRVGKGDVADLDRRPQRGFQADLAVQRQVAAGGVFYRGDDVRLVFVRVELGDRDRRDTHHQDDNGATTIRAIRSGRRDGVIFVSPGVGPAGRGSPAF